jgi:hypothetical protein
MLVRKLCFVKLSENILCMFAEVVMRLGKHFSINLLLSCELRIFFLEHSMHMGKGE